MVLKATHFTPEILLGSPRRSAGVPNPSGTLVAFTVSTYSFEKHAKSTEFKLLEVKTGDSWLITENDKITDFRWIDDDQFLALQGLKDGTTDLYCCSAAACIRSFELGTSHYSAGSIAAPAANLKIAHLGASEVAVVVAAEASPDGSLYNETAAKPLRSTAKLYDSLYVRHWDRYETKEKNSLWYGRLKKEEDGRYRLSKLTNALKHLPLECPIRPFGGTDHFDVTHNRIIFVSRDPSLNPALSTKSNVYILAISSWEDSPSSIENIEIGGGAKTSPVFSPDGTRAAFLSMKTDGYEADQNRIYVLVDIKVTSTLAPLSGEDDHSFWELSPQSVTWTLDGKALLAVIEDRGNAKLFYLPVQTSDKVQPRVLTQNGCVNAVNPLVNGNIFLSSTSLIDSSFYQIIETKGVVSAHDEPLWLDSISNHGEKFGLIREQVYRIWTPANNPEINKHVQSWIFIPSNLKKSQKYPVAYLIHGGPQGAWADSWSTRWNPAVFAEQGYIVVAPNITGSTGYGQKFTDAINKNWGGDPYEDIVKVFDWVGQNISEADNDRAVALGGSYGGYMMNWIQGHDLGRKFKALVNHDGIFATAGLLSTDELYFPFFDLGGTSYYDPHNADAAQTPQQAKLAMYRDWKMWDPSEHLSNWSTPELVIHSAKDFRLAISEGLATYNVLQARGINSQFLTFPDENHWVLKPENSLVWHKVVLNWINKYVGLPPYSAEDIHSDEFYGGIKTEDECSDMPTQGQAAI